MPLDNAAITEDEYKLLVRDVNRLIWGELAGTIPPSLDIMRGIAFEDAAKKAVNLCLERVNVEVNNATSG